MTTYYIEKDGDIVLADKNKSKIQTTLKFTPQFKSLEIKETEKEIILKDGKYCFLDDIQDELLQEAKALKIQEASDKAFEYRNKTGLISFDGRPVALPLAEGETTLTVHTELLNQDDMFQRIVGFQQGIFQEDQIYNTKEEIDVLVAGIKRVSGMF